MNLGRFSLALSSLVLLVGCGKEVGRVPFSAPGTASADVTLQAGEVAFWTDIDAEFHNDSSLPYTVHLEQGGASVGTAMCNPLGHINVKTSWVETNLGNKRSRSGMGKMECSVSLAKGGPTTVKVTLGPAKDITVKKADLVLKQ
jgi:hypothetical protein